MKTQDLATGSAHLLNFSSSEQPALHCDEAALSAGATKIPSTLGPGLGIADSSGFLQRGVEVADGRDGRRTARGDARTGDHQWNLDLLRLEKLAVIIGIASRLQRLV